MKKIATITRGEWERIAHLDHGVQLETVRAWTDDDLYWFLRARGHKVKAA